jgi:hypothetical protein
MSTVALIVDKAEQVVHGGHELTVRSQNLSGVVNVDFASIEQLVSFGQRANRIGREVAAFEGYDVDTAWPCRLAFDEHEGRYILDDAAHTTNEAVAAYRRKMMHGDDT